MTANDGQLFLHGDGGEACDQDHQPTASVETPIGVVASGITNRGPVVASTGAVMLPGGQRVSRWRSDELRIELLEARYTPHLPPGMSVAAAHAMIWRLEATDATDSVRIDARMASLDAVTLYGNASGERLAAVEFYGDGWCVHLGTEDEESLSARAANDEWFPRRWSGHDGWPRDGWWQVGNPSGLPWFEQDPSGISLTLPSLKPGDRCQVHVEVAWQSDPPDMDPQEQGIAAWFAVDEASHLILAAAHVDH